MAKLKILPKQREFLQSKKKTVAYIGSIGSGKSWISGEKCVQLLLQGAYILVVAPNYKQLKNVLMMEIQEHLRHHGIKFTMNQSDMSIVSGKGKVFGYSAESVESIRGISVDALIMDEATIIDRYVYEVSVGRIRRGKVPYQVFLTTSPRGKDWVYDLCMEENTHYIHQTIYDNYFLPKEYIEQLELEYGGDFMRQELLGEFVDMSAGDSQIISAKDITIAQSRIAQLTDDPIVAGLDVARYGEDSSVLTVRKGNQILYYKKFNNIPLTALRDLVIDDVIAQSIETLVVDGVGLGAGLVDMLKECIVDTCTVVEFVGSYAASSIKYNNLRTECLLLCKDWVRSTGVLPNDDIVNDMTTLNYSINTHNKMVVEGKDKLKARGEKSPDFFDSLSMTFGAHAKKKDSKGLKKRLKLARGRYQG